MGKRVLLFANDVPGFEVAKYLTDRGDTIVRLYLHSQEFRKKGKEITGAANVKKSEIFLDMDLQDEKHIETLKKLSIDFIISVYWRLLLPENVLKIAKEGTVNFHPAYLPIGRGWYPHVFNMIYGNQNGVTLHAMDVGADSGPIWAQKKISVEPYDTAKTIYLRSQQEIVNLFKETWPKIAEGKIKPKIQDTKKTIYYKKKDIESLDKLDLSKSMKVKDLLMLLRARSFGNLGFAYYEENGKKVYVNLRLGKTNNFKD